MKASSKESEKSGTQIKYQTEAKLLHALQLCTRKNLPYLPKSAQHSDCKHNKGWKINFRIWYLPAYLPATTKYLPAISNFTEMLNKIHKFVNKIHKFVNKKRRTTKIIMISVVRLIIYSYSESLLLKVKLTSPPRSQRPGCYHQPLRRCLRPVVHLPEHLRPAVRHPGTSVQKQPA